jgi:hypothetical protein
MYFIKEKLVGKMIDLITKYGKNEYGGQLPAFSKAIQVISKIVRR